MIRVVTLFILLTISTAIFATDTVRLNTAIDLVVTAVTDTSYTLNSTKPSGDATADSAPAKIYVPISYSGNSNYFLLKGTTPVYNYIFDISDVNHIIRFPLYVNVGVTDKYLHMAVKDGSSYKYVKAYGSVINNVTNTSYNFEVSPFTICAQMTNPSCADLTTRVDEKTTLLYFFLSTSASFADGQTIDPAASPNTGGIYFQLNMSNRTYPSLEITISNVRQGDRRAFIVYSGNATILQPKYIRVFERAASSLSAAIGIVTGTLYTKEFTYGQSGELAVTDLVNNQTYNLSAMFVDNYLFATKLSPTKAAKPLQIEELLKKQGCFLLTAGFGEEHYVIEYFKHFRDAVLSHSKLGRMFIHFYYENAPKYALQIYQSDTLRFLIRSMAYVTYFLFNFSWVLVGLFMFAYLGRKMQKNREKIKYL